MLKEGIWNRHLLAALATLGHTDELVIADGGLPIPLDDQPGGPLVVDLSLVAGTPRFLDVLDAVLAQVEVEGATAATEIEDENPDMSQALNRRLDELNHVSHEDLKRRVEKRAKVIVRTGEDTPYANVILRSGVPF